MPRQPGHLPLPKIPLTALKVGAQLRGAVPSDTLICDAINEAAALLAAQGVRLQVEPRPGLCFGFHSVSLSEPDALNIHYASGGAGAPLATPGSAAIARRSATLLLATLLHGMDTFSFSLPDGSHLYVHLSKTAAPEPVAA